MLAGIAGALYVPQVGIINPGEFEPHEFNRDRYLGRDGRSGVRCMAPPCLVLCGVNYAKTWFTGAFPEFWLFALGVVFIGSTLFLPRGLTGLLLAADRRH